MTAIDPYRTLGLAPGASQAEIKRAYRQLAKLYHPDSAGERALARFLAIQAAYEALVDEPGRPRAGPRWRRPTRPAGPPPPPWQADAARARATSEAYRARARRGPTGAAGAAGTGPADRGRVRRRATLRVPGAPSGDAAGSGRSTRRRKATIGSTSYDGVEAEPFTPPWEGATWYGAGSGTYWTLNPKEYADPRKHGPEYLARSRRASAAARAGEPSGADGRDGPAPDRRSRAGGGAGGGGRGAGGIGRESARESARASAATAAASAGAAADPGGDLDRRPDPPARRRSR